MSSNPSIKSTIASKAFSELKPKFQEKFNALKEVVINTYIEHELSDKKVFNYLNFNEEILLFEESSNIKTGNIMNQEDFISDIDQIISIQKIFLMEGFSIRFVFKFQSALSNKTSVYCKML
jgi:hypothetical protein